MPPIQHNGGSFQYIIQYYKEGFESNVKEIQVNDWTIFEKYEDVGANEVYEPYIINVRAKNSKGYAREDPREFTGYTGEDSEWILLHFSSFYIMKS